MTKSGSLDLNCGEASYDIVPPDEAQEPAPVEITVGTRHCIDKPENIHCWKDVHQKQVDETAREFPIWFGRLDDKNFNADSSNLTQVLRDGGDSGHGVVYMMNLGWIPECTVAESQKADYPVPGNTDINYSDLLKDNYYKCRCS